MDGGISNIGIFVFLTFIGIPFLMLVGIMVAKRFKLRKIVNKPK